MLNPVYSNTFKKDAKLAKKRHLDLDILRFVLSEIAYERALPGKYRNHKLTGNWKDHWECHLAPDWLLIYKLDGEDVIFERTGTHADLF
jgi:mRNA interferase YafQ